ncbi:MAG: MFS transporter [Planctomycetota bacterium]
MPNARLNWLNFFAADVGDGIGPFVATFLITTSQWNESSIGAFLLTLNLATVIAQTPVGWLIDQTRFKRFLASGAAFAIALCVLVPAFASQKVPTLVSAAVLGVAAAILPPAISAMTLGIVGPKRLTQQTGSNQAFNHAGNLFAAIAIGLVAYFLVPWGFAPIVAVLASVAGLVVLTIPEQSIDHDVARGGLCNPNSSNSTRSSWATILSTRPLLIFMFCVGLFHLSNAAMLPLAGQKLAIGDADANGEQSAVEEATIIGQADREGNSERPKASAVGQRGQTSSRKQLATLYLSLCVVVAQIVMIGVSILIGRRADRWGRKRFLLIGFASLPIRGFLFSQVTSPFWVIAGQILDGIGAGVYGVMAILVVADLTRGTGVFNFAAGMVITVQGLGASIGSWLGEWWAGAYGYSSSYTMLTTLGIVALLTLAILMPETNPSRTPTEGSDPDLKTSGPSPPSADSAQETP